MRINLRILLRSGNEIPRGQKERRMKNEDSYY